MQEVLITIAAQALSAALVAFVTSLAAKMVERLAGRVQPVAA